MSTNASITGGKEGNPPDTMSGRMTTSEAPGGKSTANLAHHNNLLPQGRREITNNSSSMSNLPPTSAGNNNNSNTGLVRSVLSPQLRMSQTPPTQQHLAGHHHPGQHHAQMLGNHNTGNNNNNRTQLSNSLAGFGGGVGVGGNNGISPHILEQLQLLEAQQQGHGMTGSGPMLGMQMNDGGAALASFRGALGNVPAPNAATAGMFNGQSRVGGGGVGSGNNLQDALQRQELLAALAMVQQQQQQQQQQRLSYLSGGGSANLDSKSFQLAQQLGLAGIGGLGGLGSGSLSSQYDLQSQLQGGGGGTSHLDLLQAQLLLKQQQSHASQAPTASQLLALSGVVGSNHQQQQSDQLMKRFEYAGNGTMVGRDGNSKRESSSNKLCRVPIRVPCCARDMPIEHNFQTAYFTIEPNMDHGTPLVCSYESCRVSGTKFRYCLYCDKAVHKRNFWKEHKHSEEERQQTQKQQQQEQALRDSSINKISRPTDGNGSKEIHQDQQHLNGGDDSFLADQKTLHNLSQMHSANNANIPRNQPQPVKVSLRSDGTFTAEKNALFNSDSSTNGRKRDIEDVLDPSSAEETCYGVEKQLISNWVGLLMERPQTEESHAMRQWLQSVLSISESVRVQLVTNGVPGDSPVEHQKQKQEVANGSNGTTDNINNSTNLSTSMSTSKGGSDEGDDEAEDDVATSEDTPNREEVETEEV